MKSKRLPLHCGHLGGRREKDASSLTGGEVEEPWLDD